jgi:hypothetical protein
VAVNDAGTALAGRSANALTGERITTLLDDPAEAPDDAVWRARVLQGESSGRRRIRRRTLYARHLTSRCGPPALETVLVLAVCVRDRAGGRSGRRTSRPADRARAGDRRSHRPRRRYPEICDA